MFKCQTIREKLSILITFYCLLNQTWNTAIDIYGKDTNFVQLFIGRNQELNMRGAFDSDIDSSVLSNPADARNASCLGLCGRDICPKSSA